MFKNTYKKFKWYEQDGNVTIIKYEGSKTDVIVPNKIKGMNVTDIADTTFFFCRNLNSVVIPEGITSIGKFAFAGCTELTYVNLPTSLKTIGNYCFLECVHLKSINIPEGVTDIGCNAFEKCYRLKTITLPASVTKISEKTFIDCYDLKSITIPNSITAINDWVFFGCNNLKSPVSNYKACSIVGDKYVCRDTEYKLNEWSETINNIETCDTGYHYCTNLFDIFTYYAGRLDEDIAIFEIEIGDISEPADEGDNYIDSKHCTNRIRLIKRLSREEIIAILNIK